MQACKIMHVRAREVRLPNSYAHTHAFVMYDFPPQRSSCQNSAVVAKTAQNNARESWLNRRKGAFLFWALWQKSPLMIAAP